MTALGKLLRTTAFKLSLAYLVMFAIGAGLVLVRVGVNVKNLIDEQIDQTVEAELTGLAEQYGQGGIRRLVDAVERRARHADALRRDGNPSRLQRGKRDAVALAFGADAVVHRNAAVVEVDLGGVAGMLAELVLQTRHLITRRIRRHDKSAHALLAGTLVGDGDDDGELAVLTVGDELLDAIDAVVITLASGGGAQR